MNPPLQRVSPIASPEEYVLPGRPESGSPSTDAYRQAQFVLGPELDLFADAMNLNLALVKDAYPSAHRTHALAAMMALFSRSYACLADAALLLTRGSYSATLPLVRTSCEMLAAAVSLQRGAMHEYTEWLTTTLHPDETHKAFEFELGRYFSGEMLARDDVLGAAYRASSELGRPNFGSSLLFVAPESNNIRLAIAFADVSFHLGFAELTLGWLLALSARQVLAIVEADAIFPISDERRSAYAALQQKIDSALARNDRCHVEELTDDNQRRYLLHNFRRTAGNAPKKIVL